jgi:glycosyltransferase involved in cell wall biosynthesis
LTEIGKKKVLFVIDTLQIGGAEQSLLENTIRFKKIIPVVCHVYQGDALRPGFMKNGITVYSIGIEKKYGFLRAYRKLKEIIARERPDALVAYLTRSEIISRIAGKKSNVPVIGTFVSNLYSREYNSTLSFAAKRAVSFFKMINKVTAGYCAGFIANSEAVRQSNAAQLGVSLQKIKVISRGRDSNVFSFRPPVPSVGNAVRFLNIGRLVPVKGQDLLIKGFEAFLEIYPDAELHIIGEGPARHTLQELILQSGLGKNVFLAGARQDVPAIIHNYDCFVFPSLSEGFSGSVIEAMFAGLPVLASDIAPNLETVSHLETGYIFGKNSASAITEALKWFMTNRDKATAFAANANVHVKQHFELEKIAGELESYLQKIIETKN